MEMPDLLHLHSSQAAKSLVTVGWSSNSQDESCHPYRSPEAETEREKGGAVVVIVRPELLLISWDFRYITLPQSCVIQHFKERSRSCHPCNYGEASLIC